MSLNGAQVRADGMVINTMGWVDNLGYDLLLHSIKALKADVVIVVGQDRLHSQLRSELRLLLTLPYFSSSCDANNFKHRVILFLKLPYRTATVY